MVLQSLSAPLPEASPKSGDYSEVAVLLVGEREIVMCEMCSRGVGNCRGRTAAVM